MKRILDPEFHYRPSFDTDLKQTFERVRREQQPQLRALAQVERLDDRRGTARRIGADVDANGLRRWLEHRKLAVEE